MRRSLLLILELAACEATGAHREPSPRVESQLEVRASESAPPSVAAVTADPRARRIPSLAKRLRSLTRGRYMEGSCKRAERRGWEGFPLRRCRYAVPDARGHKSAEVILLNPSAKRLATWIGAACEGRGEACIDKLVDRIRFQSSAQFPVAGIVLEDIRPHDGHYEMYCFRDGVRVEVEGFETLSTARPEVAHFDSCLEGKLVKPTSFARIAGTTPAEYRAAGGEELVEEHGVPTARWLDVTRTLYQSAWRGPRNALLDAWVAANPD